MITRPVMKSLLFVALLLVAPLSSAATLYTATSMFANEPTWRFASDILACKAEFNYNRDVLGYSICPEATDANVYVDGTKCAYWTQQCANASMANIITQTGDCSESAGNYVDDGNGVCILAPECPVDAPAAYLVSQPNSIPTSPINNNGCSYSYTFDNGDPYVGCWILADGTSSCTFKYSPNGQSSTSTPYTLTETPTASTGETNNIKDSGSASTDVAPPIDNGDGTTTQVTTESQVKTNQAGHDIWEDPNYIYVKSTTGTVTQYDKVSTTITNIDGSKTEVVSIGSTVATPAVDSTTITKATSTSTTTNNTSTTIDNSTVTTNVYNSSGQLVSSTTNTTGDGKGTGDENAPGNCGAPDQPPCEVELANDGEFTDPAETLSLSGIIDALTSFETSIQSTETETTEFFKLPSFNLYSGGGCDPAAFGTTYYGEPFQLLIEYCPIHEAYVRPAFNWAFYMLTLIGLYSIFIHTFRKT